MNLIPRTTGSYRAVIGDDRTTLFGPTVQLLPSRHFPNPQRAGPLPLASVPLSPFPADVPTRRARGGRAWAGRVRAGFGQRNSQDLWMRFLTDYAATSSFCFSDRSTLDPSYDQ